MLEFETAKSKTMIESKPHTQKPRDMVNSRAAVENSSRLYTFKSKVLDNPQESSSKVFQS